jgi:succinate dehydrogenase / fumarate reductase iron-sulfur subunit
MQQSMRLKLTIWRQPRPSAPGKFVDYEVDHISPDMSFLEMLDTLNEKLILTGEDPISFDHDCREGICGSCGFVIDGQPHGPWKGTTVCQLHMRQYRDGDHLVIEPWRARAFPVIKDLTVDRRAFDRIIAAGGYISVNTGGAPDANAIPVPKGDAEKAFEAAACIGCGACVAACKNASAMLFVSAKVAHLGHLPQGRVEHGLRVLRMVSQMDAEGFGNCTNEAECEAVCPKEIPMRNIAHMNGAYLKAMLGSDPDVDLRIGQAPMTPS